MAPELGAGYVVLYYANALAPEQAAMMATARHFLFRVPSECVPLQIKGDHSEITFEADEVIIVLSSRKNSRSPSVLRKACCCKSSGRELCSFHWLRECISVAQAVGRERIFTKTAAEFVTSLRAYASAMGLSGAAHLGTVMLSAEAWPRTLLMLAAHWHYCCALEIGAAQLSQHTCVNIRLRIAQYQIW